METLAYHLTPEIQTWFTRIDPFTNGMPSLHIGIPFAVWLGLHRWDHDERWKKYRIFVGWFTALTGFSIIYLGIHWLLDITGGIIVAYVAVRCADQCHDWLWYRLDERTFNARLAWLFADINNPIARRLTSNTGVVSCPTFSPDGKILFLNLYNPTMTFAIKGPWDQL